MGRLAFCSIGTEENLARYLKQVLYRRTSTMCLYHYTTFSTFKKIYESGGLRLNKPEAMNDKLESDGIKSNRLSQRMFYSCFSLVEENAEMWNMYTSVNDGCMMKIYFKRAKAMLEYPLYLGDTKELCEQENIEDFCFSSVAYRGTSKITGEDYLKCRTALNKKHRFDYKSSNIAGMIKNDFWRYENEARLILRTKKDFDE